MGGKVIAREQVKQVLEDWVAGTMDELQVWQWGEQAKEAGGSADALVRDLVDTLAVLPFDMITSEDALVMLDALANPLGETDLSVNLLWNHLDGISPDGRREALKEHVFYGQFCDGMG